MNICLHISNVPLLLSGLFVSFIPPLVSSGTEDVRCAADLQMRGCRAGQWKHQQRETMSHDSAVNNALFLFFLALIIIHLFFASWTTFKTLTMFLIRFYWFYIRLFRFLVMYLFIYLFYLPSSPLLYGFSQLVQSHDIQSVTMELCTSSRLSSHQTE